MKINKSLLVAFSFLAGLSLLWYFPIFELGHDNDTSRFLPISYYPEASSFSYWWQVFSKPINFVQYRPLSFFAIYQIFGGDFYNTFPYIYPLIGLFLFLAGLYQFLLLLNDWSVPINTTVGLGFLFAFHISQIGLYSYSFSLKYFYPLFLSVFLLRVFFSDEEISRRKILLLTVMLSLGIMSHEACFVMPFIFILKRKFLRQSFNLLIAVPSFLYLSMRLIKFGVPKEGGFEVSFAGSFKPLGYYLHGLWSYSLDMSSITPYPNKWILWGYGIFILVFIYSVFQWKRHFDRRFLYLLIWQVMLLVPYCIIPKHVLFTRLIYIHFTVLLWFAVLRMKKPLMSYFCIGLYGVLALYPAYQMKQIYIEKMTVHREIVNGFSDQLIGWNPESENHLVVKDDDWNAFYPLLLGLYRESIQNYLKEGQAAMLYVKADNGERPFLWIEKQRYYYEVTCEGNKCQGEDPYHFPYQFEFEQSRGKEVSIKETYLKATKKAQSI